MNLQKSLAQQALEQARAAQKAQSDNALLGSLIQTGGSIAGGAIGAFGGPAGTMAGSKIGGTLANSIYKKYGSSDDASNYSGLYAA